MLGLISTFLAIYIQEPHRWRYFGDFSVVNSISCGTRYVYIGGEKGIMRFDKLYERWETPISRVPFPKNINLIAIDAGEGEVWFATDKELGRYNPVFENYKINSLPSGYRTPCAIGIGKDYVYLRVQNEYLQFSKLKNIWESFDSLPSHIEWNPQVFPSQYPWLAPYYVMDEYLNRYEMICAAEDFQCVWIGTRGSGVYKYSTVNYQAECYMLGIPGGKVTSIWKDEKYLWLGCSRGIVRWNPNKNTHIYYSRDKFYGPSPSKITSIVGNESYIWVGTEKGVFQFDKKEKMWSTFPISNALPSKYVTSLTVDNNKLWIGTQNGLASLELGRSGEVFRDVWINDVKVNKGELWIATSKGVLRKTKEGWKKFEDPDKILSHGVYRILFKEDRIYFATNRQGVLVWDAEKWKRFTYPICLPGEQVFSIACDEDNLYVGTDKGVAICALDYSKCKQYNSINSPIDGEVYAIYVDEKVAYFGTASGLISLIK